MARVGSLFDELSLGTKARLLILGTLDMGSRIIPCFN